MMAGLSPVLGRQPVDEQVPVVLLAAAVVWLVQVACRIAR
jgi:hypothetical protein